jgi:NAD(P)-dependent dehydrogenase (short-subunit alcohol dehydrogenase family)
VENTNADERPVVLVVGAAGGIGSEVCRALSQAGHLVVGGDARIPDTFDRSLCDVVLAGDIVTQADDLVADAIAAAGHLDAVVNLVGFNTFADMLDISPDIWRNLLDVNLTGAFMLSCAAARHMRTRGRGGSIVHFTSVTSLFGSPGQAVYAAAKAGLGNLVKSMALEWAPFGVRVNAVSPVMTRTPINAQWLDDDPTRGERIAAKIPLGRLGTPRDFAGIVRFLISDEAAFITGQTVYADGGTSVVHPLLGVRGNA